MKKAWLDWREARLAWWIMVIPAVLAALFLTGCEDLGIPPIHRPAGKYTPVNVYRKSDSLPSRIKRVAVLPLAPADASAMLGSGVDAMQPVLQSELGRAKRFELVMISPDQLTQWFGKSGLRSEERLPRDLFERLHEQTGCDAILFSQLTKYQPYQPLAIGWKLSLVENMDKDSAGEPQSQILWSADETFDAGDPAVANSAQKYYTQHLRREIPISDSSTVLASPSRFGEYTLNALLETMPKR